MYVCMCVYCVFICYLSHRLLCDVQVSMNLVRSLSSVLTRHRANAVVCRDTRQCGGPGPCLAALHRGGRAQLEQQHASAAALRRQQGAGWPGTSVPFDSGDSGCYFHCYPPAAALPPGVARLTCAGLGHLGQHESAVPGWCHARAGWGWFGSG